MELKVKYQYTYFIKPFLIKENKYKKYLLSLLKNEKFELKFFEKERDLNIYSYFLPEIRDYIFPTFNYDKQKVKEFEEMDNVLKSNLLADLHCNVFNYKLSKKAQGKVNDNEGIFFNITNIEVVCFDSGICFLLIKTDLENNQNFSNLLDFNYKFKDINSEFSKLKEYNNIKIQTDEFSNMKEMPQFIQEVIGVNSKLAELKDIDMYNRRFFVYTYACVEQDNWGKFSDIENDFIKFTNVLPNNNTIAFNGEKLEKIVETVEQFKNARFGFTKQSATFLASGIDTNNYTKLLFEYDNDYLYTLIFSLYQRIYLKKMEMDLKSKKNIDSIRRRFTKFTKEIWGKELTNSVTGTTFYSKWKKTFELEEIYNNIKNKYDVIYKDSSVEKENKVNKVILIALSVSLLLNVINLFVLMKIK